MACRAPQASRSESRSKGEFFANGLVRDFRHERFGFRKVHLRSVDFIRTDSVGELGERVRLGGKKIPGEALVAISFCDFTVEPSEVFERDGRGTSVGLSEPAEKRAAASEIRFLIRRKAPSLRAPGNHGQPCRWPGLVVSVVAPSGEQDASGIVL